MQINHKCGTGRIPSRRKLWPSCRHCVFPPGQVTDLSSLIRYGTHGQVPAALQVGKPGLRTPGPGKNVEEAWVSECVCACVCVLRLPMFGAGVCASP